MIYLSVTFFNQKNPFSPLKANLHDWMPKYESWLPKKKVAISVYSGALLGHPSIGMCKYLHFNNSLKPQLPDGNG